MMLDFFNLWKVMSPKRILYASILEAYTLELCVNALKRCKETRNFLQSQL